MPKVLIDPKNMAAAEDMFPADLPVTMVNLVSFNKVAQYEDQSQPACSGQDAYYKRYVPTFNEVAEKLGITGIEVLYGGNVSEVILGPAEPKWESIALVRYPSFAVMRKMLEDPYYLEHAEPHRLAALKEWEWISCYEPVSASS